MNESPPTEGALLENQRILANEIMFAIALQHRRLHTPDPGDTQFVFRSWWDLQFLINALGRLLRIARTIKKQFERDHQLHNVIADLNAALGSVQKLRNIHEHVEKYLTNNPNRHDQSATRRDIQVGSWNGVKFRHLGEVLDIDVAKGRAESFVAALNTTKLRLLNCTPSQGRPKAMDWYALNDELVRRIDSETSCEALEQECRYLEVWCQGQGISYKAGSIRNRINRRYPQGYSELRAYRLSQLSR